MDTTITQQELQTDSLNTAILYLDMLEHSSSPAVKAYTVITKRVFDILASTVLLLAVCSWLFPILCIFIKLSSPGPVFFVQKRMGYKGRVFKCIKFRTMHVNAQADSQEAVVRDKRITPLGRLLRKTGMDELPQLLNVLLGDMSIVGPRPHMLLHHVRFSAEMPNYNYRHTVRPGITGLAQVKGYHGSISDHFSIYGRTRLDLFYAKKSSLALDLIILANTLPVIIPLLKRSRP
jgi:putative colanic acid biosynthesis UDP-glucose lipid carrier transferase